MVLHRACLFVFVRNVVYGLVLVASETEVQDYSWDLCTTPKGRSPPLILLFASPSKVTPDGAVSFLRSTSAQSHDEKYGHDYKDGQERYSEVQIYIQYLLTNKRSKRYLLSLRSSWRCPIGAYVVKSNESARRGIVVGTKRYRHCMVCVRKITELVEDGHVVQ